MPRGRGTCRIGSPTGRLSQIRERRSGVVQTREPSAAPLAPDAPGPGPKRAPLSTADIRQLIPALGLKEYWYPALEAKAVKGKPVGLKICGVDLVFFRGQQ